MSYLWVADGIQHHLLLHVCHLCRPSRLIFLYLYPHYGGNLCHFFLDHVLQINHWSCKPGVESSNLSEGFYGISFPDEPIEWKFVKNAKKVGLNRDSNPGPLAPKARIIPLDHWATRIPHVSENVAAWINTISSHRAIHRASTMHQPG